MNNMRTALNENERGSALVEFGIVFPLFIFMFFAAYEFSNFLERWQQTTTYSRAAANNVFRECAADRNDPNQEVTNRLTQCVEAQRQKILSEVNQLSPSLDLVISVYRFDRATNSVSRSAIVGAKSTRPSKFSASDFSSASTVYGRAVRDNEVLVVGEAYSDSSIIGLLDISVSLLKEAYASTIM